MKNIGKAIELKVDENIRLDIRYYIKEHVVRISFAKYGNDLWNNLGRNISDNIRRNFIENIVRKDKTRILKKTN